MRFQGSIYLVLTAATLLLLAPAPAARADVSTGLRGGLSVNPDQFLIGGQLEFAPIAKQLYVVPSGEAGFGDDLFTLSFNGDLQYRFRAHSDVKPYAGGGLSLYFVDSDFGGSDTQLGVNILGGIYFGRNSRKPMFIDAKVGLTDEVPDWKFVFGVTFH
jgi:hypothetical protein